MINISVVHGLAGPNYSNDCKGITSMSIYSPITITEDIEDNFRPTRLYIKELHGLKYFGKTILDDIYKYSGSGIRWNNHVKKYGKEHIKTIWISDWFYCPRHLQDFALSFSEANDIVKSSEWANLSAENGLPGGHYNLSAKTQEERKEIYAKVSNTLLNKTPEQKEQSSLKHTKSLTENWNNRSEEERMIHAINTSEGLKKMWQQMSDEDRIIRKRREMETKNSKTTAEIAEISEKQKKSRYKLLYRTNVMILKEIADSKGIKLGKNWRSRSDVWVNEKIKELSCNVKIVLPDGELPKVKGQDDADRARWVPLVDVKSDECFEDHWEIIQHFVGA